MKETDVYKKLIDWGKSNQIIRSIILTSSRVTPNSNVDVFSDYDIELHVTDINQFRSDDWLSFFGDILIRWPLTPTINEGHATRLVLFKNGIRIDFQITDNRMVDSSKYDNGYKVLLDKDQMTNEINVPTYSEFIIRKPTEKEFEELINEFFWDSTYVVKNLWRDELYYAKYMFDGIIRSNYLQKMIEWYIGMQHDWSVSTNKNGRLFKKYLDEKTWKELESTFAGADIEDNWKAFFNMVNLFSRLAKKISDKLHYRYPIDIEKNAIEYYQKSKNLEK